MAGRGYECGELGVGDLVRVDPEAGDAGRARGAFLAVDQIRTHGECARRDAHRIGTYGGTFAGRLRRRRRRLPVIARRHEGQGADRKAPSCHGRRRVATLLGA